MSLKKYLKYPRVLIITFVVIITGVIVLLFGRSEREPVLEHNQIGDRYRVIWNLYAWDDTIWTLGEIASNHSSIMDVFYKFEEGDIFEITKIERVSTSSWNTGSYSYLVLKLKLLTGERKGEVFEANSIINSHEIGIDLGLPVLEKVNLSSE